MSKEKLPINKQSSLFHKALTCVRNQGATGVYRRVLSWIAFCLAKSIDSTSIYVANSLLLYCNPLRALIYLLTRDYIVLSIASAYFS